MTIESVTPILNVRNVPKSLAWFEALGWERTFTWNSSGSIDASADCNEAGDADFAGLCTGKEAQLFLCRDGQGHRVPDGTAGSETSGVWMSWWISTPEALHSLYAKCLELGYEVPAAPKAEPWGVTEFQLRHPDGHTFRISCGSA